MNADDIETLDFFTQHLPKNIWKPETIKFSKELNNYLNTSLLPVWEKQTATGAIFYPEIDWYEKPSDGPFDMPFTKNTDPPHISYLWWNKGFIYYFRKITIKFPESLDRTMVGGDIIKYLQYNELVDIYQAMCKTFVKKLGGYLENIFKPKNYTEETHNLVQAISIAAKKEGFNPNIAKKYEYIRSTRIRQGKTK